MFTQEDLLRALDDCVVPSLRRSIVEANLVRRAELHHDLDAPGSGVRGMQPRFQVLVTLRAPGGDDAVNAQLRAAVENRLLGLPAISRAEVRMEPPLFPILSRG